MNRLMLSVFWILLTLASLPSLLAQEGDWPRTVPMGQGMVTIYSPQIDEMNDNIIQYRAALAYRATPGAEPVFGAGWFESPVKIDSAKRIVHPTDLSLTETRFRQGQMIFNQNWRPLWHDNPLVGIWISLLTN